LKGVKVKLAVQ